jgi:hypothetical protein
MDSTTIVQTDTLSDQELKLFSAIKRFVNDLVDSFEDQHSLILYNHLINKTKNIHLGPVRKHLSVFSQFCETNRAAILAMSKGDFAAPALIEYSSNVFIDMSDVLSKTSDKETLNNIFKHLLLILAMVDPASNAKTVLSELSATKSNGGGDEIIPPGFSKIVDKIKNHINVDDMSNPMKAVQSLMSKNVFADILKTVNDSIKDGSLDLGEMASQMNRGGADGMDMSDMMSPIMAMMNPDNPMFQTLSSGMAANMGMPFGPMPQNGPAGRTF